MTKKVKLKWLIIPAVVWASQAAFGQKKVISIQSSIEIKAQQNEIFVLLKNLERYPEWSPFLVSDPQQKHTVTGINGEIGATFYWLGVSENSKGYQTLSQTNVNDYIKFDCTIEKPFKGNPVFEYKFIQKNNGILVTQDFNLRLSGFSYFMTKLFGVKKKMTAINQLGLERLKKLSEKETSLN